MDKPIETNPLEIIRFIVRTLFQKAVSDYKITKLASESGFPCKITPDLKTLELQEQIELLEFVAAAGKEAGMRIEVTMQRIEEGAA
jgi:hypothetical protein